MIDKVFPRAHRRYSTLPLFGAVAADFTRWLHAQGLQPQTLRQHLAAMRYIDHALRRRGMRQLHELVVDDLRTCWQGCRRCRTHLSAAANALGVFLTERSVVTPCSSSPASATATLVTAYATHLREIRGLSEGTIHPHRITAAQLLDQLQYDHHPACLSAMTASDLETFARTTGQRVSRETLQHVIGQVRGFLRFLVFRGMIRAGLERQIDTPRCY